MKTFFKQLLALALALGFVAAAGAWQGPAQEPPAGNVAAPVNVSSGAQSKQGTLGVGGLGVFGRAFVSPAAGYALPANLQLGVNGAVGASRYCDQNGQNCVTTLGGAPAGEGVAGAGDGDRIVCGGWDTKYGAGLVSGSAWGCAAPASAPACPAGYDTISSSHATINLAEQTNLCVLSRAKISSSVDQIFPGWPNAIVCNATNGAKKVLRVDGYYANGRTRYSDRPGYLYGEIGSVVSIYFDAVTKKSLIVHGNGDYGGNPSQDFPGCFDIGKAVDDLSFKWI